MKLDWSKFLSIASSLAYIGEALLRWLAVLFVVAVLVWCFVPRTPKEWPPEKPLVAPQEVYGEKK